jgi:non-specific serine/threonine protein kinase
MNNRWGVAYVLEGMAGVAAAAGYPGRALALAGAASALRDAIGEPANVHRATTLRRMREAAHRATSRPGDDQLEGAFETGRALALEDAIACATRFEPSARLGGEPARAAAPPPAPATPAPSGPRPEILSPREVEVVALIANGLTNRQIGDQLVISERTADAHVARILGKLGFASRAQVAAWAVLQGIGTNPA